MGLQGHLPTVPPSPSSFSTFPVDPVLYATPWFVGWFATALPFYDVRAHGALVRGRENAYENEGKGRWRIPRGVCGTMEEQNEKQHAGSLTQAWLLVH